MVIDVALTFNYIIRKCLFVCLFHPTIEVIHEDVEDGELFLLDIVSVPQCPHFKVDLLVGL